MRQTQLHKAQSGGAKLKIFLFLIVLAAAGFAGWYFFIREPAKEETAAEEEKIPCRSDDETLCTFIQSWDSPEKYRFIVEETSAGVTTTSTYEYDFGEPAKIHATLGNGQETITIGDTLYTKSGDVWTRQVIGTNQTDNQSASADDEEDTADDLKPIEPDHYKQAGTEPCGDLTCYKYQVFDPENPDTTQFVWFDDQEFKLRQLRFETGGVISMQTFEYVSVDIKEPSPIQGS